MAKEFHFDKVTIRSDGEDTIRVNVDDRIVQIPVGPKHKAFFAAQFGNRTKLQKMRLATLTNLLRAAYKKGRRDGSAEASPAYSPRSATHRPGVEVSIRAARV